MAFFTLVVCGLLSFLVFILLSFVKFSKVCKDFYVEFVVIRKFIKSFISSILEMHHQHP